MPEVYLDFEKPIVELGKKLQELQNFSRSHKIDVSAEVNSLNVRLQQTMQQIYGTLTPWQKVQIARHPERPYTLDYIEHLFSDFIELHGDRRFRDDKAIVGGFATFRGQKLMVIGTQKGRDMKSNMYRNFGWPHPEGYRKALRLMQVADRAEVPIVTFIDTPGAFPGLGAEERHVGEAIAVNMREMFALRVPVITIIIGEGGSGGAIGLGVGNRVLIMENAYYSVITPEGCAAILWKDRKFAAQAADSLQLTASQLLELGIVDEVIAEPFGGAHHDVDMAAANLGEALADNLKKLRKLSGKQLKLERYKKFRAMGQFLDPAAETASTVSATAGVAE